MNKLEALRSDAAIKNSLYQIYKKSKSLSVKQFKEIEKTNQKVISNLLSTASLSNAEIDSLITEKASDSPMESQEKLSENFIVKRSVPLNNNVINRAYSDSLKTNETLSNNYIDPVRGNVIKTERCNCCADRRLDADDILSLREGKSRRLHKNREERHVFLYHDNAKNNKITNPFQGKA